VDYDRLKSAISGSLKLWESGDHEEAFRLLDDLIAEAIKQGEHSWVLTLSNHAATLSRFKGDPGLVKRYYEQSVTYNPENPRALYGLAKISLEEGQTEIAKQYATRCHRAILQSGDEIIKQGLLDLVLKQWPEVG
jgi:hypothetical protein